MSHFSQYDTDEQRERLPEVMRRVSYDANTFAAPKTPMATIGGHPMMKVWPTHPRRPRQHL